MSARASFCVGVLVGLVLMAVSLASCGSVTAAAAADAGGDVAGGAGGNSSSGAAGAAAGATGAGGRGGQAGHAGAPAPPACAVSATTYVRPLWCPDNGGMSGCAVCQGMGAPTGICTFPSVAIMNVPTPPATVPCSGTASVIEMVNGTWDDLGSSTQPQNCILPSFVCVPSVAGGVAASCAACP